MRLVAIILVGCGTRAPDPQPQPPPIPSSPVVHAPVAVGPCAPGARAPLAYEITDGPRLLRSRVHAPAYPLADGRIVVVGGEADSSRSVVEIELLDAARTKWSTITPWTSPTLPYASAAIADGFVVFGPLDTFRWKSDGSWSPSPTIAVPFGAPTARLTDGRVVVLGAGLWSETADALAPFPNPQTPIPEATLASLPDGRALIAGATSLEIWDGKQSAFTAPIAVATERPARTVTALPDGRVLIAGGRSIDQWTPATGAVTEVARFREARTRHTATLLPECRVVFMGGDAAVTAEIWDAANARWQSPVMQSYVRSNAATILTATGELVVIGGVELKYGRATTRMEIWKPTTAPPKRAISWTVPEWSSQFDGPVVKIGETLVFPNAGKQWTAKDDKITDIARPPTKLVTAVAVGDGSIAALGEDRMTVYRWSSGAWAASGSLARALASSSIDYDFEGAREPDLVAVGSGRAVLYNRNTLAIWSAAALRPITLEKGTMIASVVALADGRALVFTGKMYAPGPMASPHFVRSGAKIFDPSTGTLGNLKDPPRGNWYAEPVTLADGRVMMDSKQPLVFDIATTSWKALALHLPEARLIGTLSDGRMLYGDHTVKGYSHEIDLPPDAPSMAVAYDPVKDRSTTIGPLPEVRFDGASFAFADGRVALVDRDGHTILLSAAW